MRLLIVALLAACGGNVSGMMGDDVGPDASVDPDGAVEPDVAPPLDGNEDLSAIPQSCMATRTTVDRPDDSPLPQIHVLYVLPSDVFDSGRDVSGQICNSVRGLATWFHNTSGVFLRWDTYNGELDINVIRLTKTDAQMRGNDPQNQSVDYGTAYVRERIERELVSMGKIKSNKLYAVYYEGTSVYACGGGAYPPDIKARVGAMYLNAVPQGMTTSCQQAFPWGQASLKPAYIDYGMLHEVVHSMGVVPVGAPHYVTANRGHVYDSNRDLMYSPRPSTTDPGWATNHANGLLIDVGNDDYGSALLNMPVIAPMPANPTVIDGW